MVVPVPLAIEDALPLVGEIGGKTSVLLVLEIKFEEDFGSDQGFAEIGVGGSTLRERSQYESPLFILCRICGE